MSFFSRFFSIGAISLPTFWVALFLQLITPPAELLVVFFLGCGAAFVVYDIAFSRLIALFIRRVGKYIK